MKRILVAVVTAGILTACADQQPDRKLGPVCDTDIAITKEKVGVSSRYYVENNNQQQSATGLIQANYRPDSNSGLSATKRYSFDLQPGEITEIDIWEANAFPKLEFMRCNYY
ncbi:hypothetical protein [Vibrio superstes]|uniref:hypothetical protein n=1 Tax=Vibrio superstes TaxID=198815 RepID=UPI0011BFAAF9|nr:hypothetical protein [Vibrio superstes]